jgi:hypothetical protein
MPSRRTLIPHAASARGGNEADEKIEGGAGSRSGHTPALRLSLAAITGRPLSLDGGRGMQIMKIDKDLATKLQSPAQ